MAFEPKSEYSKKLLDPRWQKKRLEILSRNDWTCALCGDTETTLNVHHRAYKTGCDPWDYPNDWLVTLCAPCHEGEGEGMREVMPDLTQELKLAFFSEQLKDLVPALAAYREFYSQIDGPAIIAFHISTPENFEKLREQYYASVKAEK